ncbi:MAG: amidase [Burkholderiales bacterium]|nr:amidase [Burkholderiales bacterium]
MPIDDLSFATMTELAAAYRARTLSPVEVTQAMLERIAALDPTLHAFVTVTPEVAIAQAKQAEAEFARGAFRGPMHGVPVGIKDLCETQGIRTTWGTKILRDHVPTADCTVVRKLFDAGAIMLGKLQMTEGAYSVHHPEVIPPVNPWNADHWPGVSSSGSGVAPAAGLCYGAIGTDTGGSIRFPSGANAITGLKPTWGRVSRHGVQALADSLDHLGPMTRCAADAGAMFAAMAGMDPNDPTTLEAPVPDCLAGIDQGIAGLRIGIDPGFVYGVCQPETAKVIDEARRVLAALGATVIELPMPDRTTPMYKDWAKYCAVETAVAHEPWYPARKAEYGPVLADLIEQGRAMDAMTLMHVHHDRLVFQGQLRKLFLDVDLLLMPVHPFGNPSAAALDEIFKTPNGIDDVLRFTAPFDMSGSPTITIPGGFDERGMPIGFQLVGRHLDEALLVRAAHAFQGATDFHRRHPKL